MKKIILAMLLVFETAAIQMVYSESVTAQISDELLRMHILANSDSAYDQSIKFEIRDYVIDYIKNEQVESKADVEKNIKKTESLINEYLSDRGAGYLCSVVCGKSEFDTRVYSDISIPAGEYDALKIILGKGEGKNWWCVAYPPLCFTESAVGNLSDDAKIMLRENLNGDVYKIISCNKANYKIKFKSVELFNGFMQKFMKSR